MQCVKVLLEACFWMWFRWWVKRIQWSQSAPQNHHATHFGSGLEQQWNYNSESRCMGQKSVWSLLTTWTHSNFLWVSATSSKLLWMNATIRQIHSVNAVCLVWKWISHIISYGNQTDIAYLVICFTLFKNSLFNWIVLSIWEHLHFLDLWHLRKYVAFRQILWINSLVWSCR